VGLFPKWQRACSGGLTRIEISLGRMCVIVSFNLNSTSALLSDLFPIELMSLTAQLLSREPFIPKEVGRTIGAKPHCIIQTKLLPVIRRLMLPLDRGDSGKEVVKYDMKLGRDTSSAQIEHLWHFSGMLLADSNEHTTPG
jgi:hypothetical protein